MTEFVVQMENRPGRLASLTEALAAFGVNIEALAAYGHDGEGTVRLIVDEQPRRVGSSRRRPSTPRNARSSPHNSPTALASWPGSPVSSPMPG